MVVRVITGLPKSKLHFRFTLARNIMDIQEDFERDGFVTGINVLSQEKTDSYSNKCAEFVREHQSHPRFSEWTYYRTELILKWVADLAAEEFDLTP